MSFSNSKISGAAKELFDASAAVQTYVAAILRQADIQLKELSDLPNYQATARNHAENWTSQVLQAIIKTNSDIIDFSYHFTSFYDTLHQLAEQIDAGKKGGFKSFKDGLGLLRANLNRKEGNVKYLNLQLEEFKRNLMGDHENFSREVSTAVKILEGNDGELQKLSADIDSINTKINAMIGTMAGGAVGSVTGIVLILVGSLAEIETEGLSTGLIIAGIGILETGITAEVVGGVEYGLAVEEKKKLQEELSTDEQAIGILKHVKGLLDGFVSQIEMAVKSVGVLEKEWSVMSDDLAKVISDLDNNPGSLGLVEMLNVARSDWEEALNLARKMVPTGNMPVKAVKNLMDEIHTK